MIATEASGESSGRLFLPPAFTGFPVAGEAHPFDVAQSRAGEEGAGALFHAERPGLFAFALVLEPDVPLARARRAFPVAMAAVADALAAHCLPERSVSIGWPGVLLYDTSRIGGGRLAWPRDCAEGEVPDWLVFGVDLIRDRDAVAEPGRFPETTSLREELFDGPLEILESFARNATRRFDLWEAQGYDAAIADFLHRLEGGASGARCRIGPTGDLLIREAGRERTRPLVPALVEAAWFDSVAGGPRL